MMKSKHVLTPLLMALLLLFSARSLALADSFSIAGGGPTPIPPDDILLSGPIPVLLGTAPPAETDAFSYGHVSVPHTVITVGSTIQFSVDLASVGTAGSAVLAESSMAASEPGADIFAAVLGSGTNILVFDGDGTSAPPLGLTEAITGSDELDGHDKSDGPGLGFIWWSVDPPTAAVHPAYPAGSSAADVFVAFVGGIAPPYSGVPLTYTTAITLGLDPAMDDIDALVVLEDGVAMGMPASPGDCVLFSLTPGSPTLGVVGAGPEDVLASGPGCPGPFLFIPGAAIGLVPGDNLDALALSFTPTAITLQEAGLKAIHENPNLWVIFFAISVMTVGLIWQRHNKFN